MEANAHTFHRFTPQHPRELLGRDPPPGPPAPVLGDAPISCHQCEAFLYVEVSRISRDELFEVRSCLALLAGGEVGQGAMAYWDAAWDWILEEQAARRTQLVGFAPATQGSGLLSIKRGVPTPPVPARATTAKFTTSHPSAPQALRIASTCG